MFARHGLERSRLHAGREWHRLNDPQLRHVLATLDPKARDDLRRVPIRDQADRDAISSRLMRYRDQNGQDWADIIDMLTMYRMCDGGWFGCSARWRPQTGTSRAPGS